MARLFAIADLHLSFKANRDEWAKLEHHDEDGLILAGDVGESLEHAQDAFRRAKRRFKHVWWVPGNHELYTMKGERLREEEKSLRGEAKYKACVKLARHYGVLTPEDPYITWEYSSTDDNTSQRVTVCPIFTLYDYSFRPDDVTRENCLEWALEEGIQAADEKYLHPDPYATRDAWCTRLLSQHEAKLEEAKAMGDPLVIVNHWPLRQDLVHIPRVPRFSLWCGTKETADWHTRFNAKVVVTGHLHVRRTDWIDGVRFEEVSLGYPRQWKGAKDEGHDVNSLLREILPGPPTPEKGVTPSTKFQILEKSGAEIEACDLRFERRDAQEVS